MNAGASPSHGSPHNSTTDLSTNWLSSSWEQRLGHTVGQDYTPLTALSHIHTKGTSQPANGPPLHLALGEIFNFL